MSAPAAHPEPIPRATSTRRRVRPALGVAFTSFVVIGVTDGVLGTAWPAIRHSLHLAIGELGLIQLAGTAGFLVSSSFSGRITAHLGRARTMAAAALVGCAAFALIAASPTLLVLLAGACGVGIAGGQIESGMQSHVALSARSRTMNLLHGCYGIGATLGPILLSGLLLLHASWRIAYLVLIAIEASVAAGVLRRRRNFAETNPPRRSARPAAATPAPTATALSRPALYSALVLFFVYTGVEVGTGQWAFTLLTAGRHLGTGLAGALVAGYWAALTGVRFAVAAAGERVDPNVILAISAVGAVLGEALLWWNPAQSVGALGLLLTGAALAPAFPLMMARTPRWADRQHVSSVIGWQSAAAGLGIAALSGLAGLLVQRFGLTVLGPYLAALATLYLALQFLALRVQEHGSHVGARSHE